ncbi:F-box protein At4g22280-like [Carex rostrata]
MDWFYSLPDDILPHILSFLSTKEAVKACILSKQWRHAWTYVPVLKFDITDWGGESVEAKERWREGEHKFKNFLSGVLKNRKPVELDMFEYKNYILMYDSEISFELIDQVELESRKAFVGISRDRVDQLELPDFIFSCTRLENLELRIYTANGKPIILPVSVNVPALKIVDLTGIALVDNDRSIQNLCSKCPVLETMVLRQCDLDTTEISSKVLKELTIYKCSQTRRTRISCPSLASLVIQSYEEMEGFELKNMTSLKYAKICFDLDDDHGDLDLLSSLSNVSHLSLGLWGSQFKVKLEEDISKCRTFRNLRTLEIFYWDLSYDIDLVVCFLKHSPSLGDLTLCLSAVIDVACSLEHSSSLEKLTLRFCEKLEEGDPKEELSQEELGNRRNVLFQREYLKTVRIIRPKRRPDMVVDRLINNLRTHIKTIGEEIII